MTFTFFNSFKAAAMNGAHNLGSDQLKIALTNVAPVVTNTVLANLTEITYTNLSSRDVTTTSSGQTDGAYKLVLVDLVLTASGAVGPFRYVVLYDDTATNKELIGFADYGSSINLADTETFTVDFNQVNGAITL